MRTEEVTWDFLRHTSVKRHTVCSECRWCRSGSVNRTLVWWEWRDGRGVWHKDVAWDKSDHMRGLGTRYRDCSPTVSETARSGAGSHLSQIHSSGGSVAFNTRPLLSTSWDFGSRQYHSGVKLTLDKSNNNWTRKTVGEAQLFPASVVASCCRWQDGCPQFWDLHTPSSYHTDCQDASKQYNDH